MKVNVHISPSNVIIQ